jgi:hypothetical protein
MNPPENKKGKCAGFVPMAMRNAFSAYTGKLAICFGSGVIYSGHTTIASCGPGHSAHGRK